MSRQINIVNDDIEFQLYAMRAFHIELKNKMDFGMWDVGNKRIQCWNVSHMYTERKYSTYSYREMNRS